MADKIISIVIELAIFSAWIYLFKLNLKRKTPESFRENIILLCSLPAVAVMEAINECVTKYTYYPHPFLRVPGFNFPIAILLAGGLFTWFIFVASSRLAVFIGKGRGLVYYTARVIFFLVMVCIGWPIEFIFSRLGYWKYNYSASYLPWHLFGVYMYYLFFSLPAVISAKLVSLEFKDADFA